MKLIFIRHFPTKGNQLKQYIGRTDLPIDAEFTGEPDGYPKVDCVVVSPMLRCVQTAELIYPDIEKISCEKLRETDFGDFEGKTYEELKELEEYREWVMSGSDGAVPNGESRADFKERCIAGFHEVMEQLLERKCETAAFVVHGGTIMALLSELAREERTFYDWKTENGHGYRMGFNAALWKQGRRCLFHIERL